MKITEADKTRLLQNSIERVLQNAIWVGLKGMQSSHPVVSERSGILVEDVQELLPLVVALWADAQEQIRKNPTRVEL